MPTPAPIHLRDRALVQIVDAAMAESVRRSGEWIACRPGCTPCCLGPFAISALDAIRLRRGLAGLDTVRASRVRQRALRYVAAIAAAFPGDAATGALHDEDALPQDWEDEPCPALDPASGLCDLYESRPMACRIFGPATRLGSGKVGACELCYEGAADEDIAAAAVEVDPDGSEQALLAELNLPPTIVAFALSLPGETP